MEKCLAGVIATWSPVAQAARKSKFADLDLCSGVGVQETLGREGDLARAKTDVDDLLKVGRSADGRPKCMYRLARQIHQMTSV